MKRWTVLKKAAQHPNTLSSINLQKQAMCATSGSWERYTWLTGSVSENDFLLLVLLVLHLVELVAIRRASSAQFATVSNIMITPLWDLFGMLLTLFRPNPKWGAASFETSLCARGQPRNYNILWCTGAQKDFFPQANIVKEVFVNSCIDWCIGLTRNDLSHYHNISYSVQ